MDLRFNTNIATGYKSACQKSRVITEDWMARNMFCPVCGAPVLGHYEANKPVADFSARTASRTLSLKAKRARRLRLATRLPTAHMEQ